MRDDHVAGAASDPDGVIDQIFALFRDHGDSAYIGEPVSMTEHMLQAAQLAEAEGAPPAEIVAALLHDLGHLLHDLPEDSADHGIDTAHEHVAGRWLARSFTPTVSEAVGLHVAAKRYLCAVEPDYLTRLSPASMHSLQLQGGPMSAHDAESFAQHPFGPMAVRLRRWDDGAKYAGLSTPPLEHYRSALRSQIRLNR